MVTVLRAPSRVLAPFVELLWYVDEPMPYGLERRLPTGGIQIVVNLAEDELRWYEGARLDRKQTTIGAGLSGPITRAIGIDTAEQHRTVGLAFRPGGAAPFFAPPADALIEPVIGLDDLWGQSGEVLRERLLRAPTPVTALALLERCLLEQVVGPLVPDLSLRAAVAGLERGDRVRDVIDRTGTTSATLGRRFRRLVGLSPKPYARLRRLQRVLDSVTRPTARSTTDRRWPTPAAPDWATVAAEHGYFDQAHLINDFRTLTGTTPTAYRPRSHLERNHLPVG